MAIAVEISVEDEIEDDKLKVNGEIEVAALQHCFMRFFSAQPRDLGRPRTWVSRSADNERTACGAETELQPRPMIVALDPTVRGFAF